VPNVVGLTEQKATNRLKAQGFQTKAEQRESTPEQLGKVIRTDPAAGATADKGSMVTLFVGSGPNTVQIPRLRGLDQNEAITKLNELGLSFTITQVSSPLPSGKVTGSDPKAGEQVPLTTQVELFVSSGTVTVPDTTDMTYDQAVAALQKVGLKSSRTDQPSDTVTADNVISSSPSPGTQVASGTTVTLMVSTGPQPVAVPDVTGMNSNDARQTLRDAGLRTATSACYLDPADPNAVEDNVVSQDPPSGTEVPPKSTVTMFVYRVSEPPTNPCP
jgi:serine/threonine-protein kinase